MRTLSKLLLALSSVCIVGTYPALADDTAKPPVTDSTTKTANATPSASSPTPAPPVFKPPAGYKTRKRGTEILYCRKETIIGSRFAKEICYSKDELDEAEARRMQLQDQMSKSQRMCTSASACGAP